MTRSGPRSRSDGTRKCRGYKAKSCFSTLKKDRCAAVWRAPWRYAKKAIALSVLLNVRRETELNIENRCQQHRGYAYQQDGPF